MAVLQKKTIKGIDYWYLIESKRINGKPQKIIIEYFGNTKKFATKLMDSRNESRILNESKILKSYTHGDTYALWQIAKKLRIEDILNSTFSNQVRDNLNRSRSLLLIAIQRVCQPGSKSNLHNWLEQTTLPYELGISLNSLTSQHFWDQMSDIAENDLVKAEDAITKAIFEKYSFEMEKIALDYTNYFSYISSDNEKCTIAKRGRNKQKRYDLKQFSLALVTTKDIGLPLCSHVYEGNINDQTEFLTYFNMLKTRIPNYDPKIMTLIFDGGSNTKINLDAIETHYICSFSLSYCKKLYDYDLSDFEEIIINKKATKVYRSTQNIWGKNRDCIITFSNALFKGQLKELEKDINTVKDEVASLNKQLSDPKSRISKERPNIDAKVKKILGKSYIKDIAAVNLSGVSIIESIELEVDLTAKDDIVHKYFGKKLIITDRTDWSTYEIVKTYREQDCIEKIFKDSKNTEHFSVRPQYHFTDKKVRVHVFCCLLGLTLATLLYKEVVSSGVDKISKIQLLDYLSQIRKCWIKDNNGSNASYVLEEMSDTHIKIWDAVNSIV